jgi:glycosyltransferase involved in cell wall biosynthesis
LFFALAKNIKNFNLIHITGIWNFPVWAGAFWAKFYKKPYIISPRGSLMKEPLEKKSSLKKRVYLFLVGRKILKNTSAIHFTTEAEREEYLAANLPLKNSFVIPNSFNLGEFEKKPAPGFFRNKFKIPQSKKVILFLGRLHPIKGLGTLIPAFTEVIKKRPDCVLVLAGPDDEGYKKEILRIINEINKKTSDVLKLKPSIFGTSDVPKIENPNIIFTGMILGDEKIAAFRESDVFVLPSYSENFGMAVIEAMSFGLPVVITRGVGVSKEVETAGAGLVVEKDIEQVAEAILKFLENPAMAKKMGEAGRELVKKEFSSDNVAERFLKEYNSLLT